MSVITRNENSVVLKWNAVPGGDLSTKYAVYRRTGGTMLIDTNISPTSAYSYALSAFIAGKWTLLGLPLIVNASVQSSTDDGVSGTAQVYDIDNDPGLSEESSQTSISTKAQSCPNPPSYSCVLDTSAWRCSFICTI